jgi:hypothetical protein
MNRVDFHLRGTSASLLAALVAAIGALAVAQPKRSAPARTPVKLEAPVQDKNLYLLSMLGRNAAARAAVQSDPALVRISAARLAALDHAASSCQLDLECYAAAFRWSDEQSAEAGRALAGLYRRSNSVRELVDGPVRASGMYFRYNQMGGEELLGRAWSDCAKGINRMIDVYGLGKPPRYPAIDAITYDVKAAGYQRVVETMVAMLEEDRAGLDLFFTPSMRFALDLMFVNHRDEAGRYEPMEAGENAAAFRRAASVEWSRYPYSVIVVPGSGNDRPGVALSPAGAVRDEIAAKRFREGKAPFVLVSGGFVHPAHTEFCEAIEMKKDLMARFKIPADAIIVDPHARHTTTNMRNAARLMYRYGFPFEKKALVTTDLSQSRSIEDPAFEKRCLAETGAVPYKLLGRISPFDLEFLPLLEALHVDPEDPLDP